jgi:hypothetical protein
VSAPAQTGDPLASWNDGPAKQTILDFVRATTDTSSPNYVPPKARIATFDQDGTTWVSHPMYTQVMYCLERVPVVAKAKPELKSVEPFKTVLSGNREVRANNGLMRRSNRMIHHSLNVGSVQPPQTQGKVQSAVRLVLSGRYLLQASARTGLIDCQMISNVPEELILPIMTGFERW